MSHSALIGSAAPTGSLWAYVADCIQTTPWRSWAEFWYPQLFSERNAVLYFLPLVAVLMVLSGRNLRLGIVATGLVFLSYVLGITYALLWLLLSLGLHRMGESFARESRRLDVPRWAPPLAATTVIAGGYIALQYLKDVPFPASWSSWLLGHAPLLLPLAFREGGDPQGPLTPLWYLFWNPHNIGLAYLAVRMLHYFSELRRGTVPVERRDRLSFLAYTFYAPNLIQGPIERYGVFQEEMDTCHLRRGWSNVTPALSRMLWGFCKALLAAVLFWPFIRDQVMDESGTYYRHPERIASTWLLYFGVYIQILWLYLQFSGYCDIAAGIARLLGYRQVENFNWPWLSRSLREFWRRWHISLSLLLRDYLYIPLGGNRRHTTMNLVLTFAICGLWHKLTFPMVIWGGLMGAMLAVNQAWSRWMAHLDAALGVTGKKIIEPAAVAKPHSPIVERFEMTPAAQVADPGLRERGAPLSPAAAEPAPGEEAHTPKWDRPAGMRNAAPRAAAQARAPAATGFTTALAKLRRGWLKLAPLPQICAWAITMHFFVHSLLIFFGGQGANRVTRELWRRITSH